MDQEKFEKVIDLIAKQLELENEISKKFVSEALYAIKTFDGKHTEKGLAKLDKFGALGVIIKMDEKYETLAEYYDPKNEEKVDEPKLLKLWEDVAVYSLMGKIIEKGEWK
jgi:polyhydroxyalkanoate synthesis regulator phasin